MKYVYVLTSSEKDYYYEQFLLSLASMRIYNHDAEIVVLTDEKTKQSLNGKRSGYEKQVSEIKVVNVPDEYPQKGASRWIKTSLRRHIPGDFLFVDCDTIITESLDVNLLQNINVGAVLDTHVSLAEHHLRNEFNRQKSASHFTNHFDFRNYFNSGIIFCKDTIETHNFFNRWHTLWIESNKHGVSVDQPSFNQADYESNNIITELPGEWNCQISHNGINFLCNAKIIHYFATTLLTMAHPYKPASAAVLSSIKETGVISEEIYKLLHHPLAAFEQNTRVVSGEYILNVFDSPLFKLLLWLRDCHKPVFNLLNSMIRFVTSLLKRTSGYGKRKLRGNKQNYVNTF